MSNKIILNNILTQDLDDYILESKKGNFYTVQYLLILLNALEEGQEQSHKDVIEKYEKSKLINN